jgi:hypothetical protein
VREHILETGEAHEINGKIGNSHERERERIHGRMGGEAYEIKKKNPLESRNQKGRERERERERGGEACVGHRGHHDFFSCMRLDFFLKAETSK